MNVDRYGASLFRHRGASSAVPSSRPAPTVPGSRQRSASLGDDRKAAMRHELLDEPQEFRGPGSHRSLTEDDPDTGGSDYEDCGESDDLMPPHLSERLAAAEGILRRPPTGIDTEVPLLIDSMSTIATPAGTPWGPVRAHTPEATMSVSDRKHSKTGDDALALLFTRNRLKLDTRSPPIWCNEKHQVGDLEPLAKGNYSSTYAVQYRRDGGGLFNAVFKPVIVSHEAGTRGPGSAEGLGIPYGDPQYVKRNLATCAIAKKLGFDVVPETYVGVAKVDGERRPGIVMERAKGASAKDVHDTDVSKFDDPKVAREIIKLQLLDHLTGQTDRHHNNYFIHQEGSAVRVTGIDNDLCFGKFPTDPNGIASDSKHSCVFVGRRMPPVLDSHMAAAIEGIELRDLDDILGKQFTSEEVSAAKSRLTGMKAHVQALRDATPSGIVDPEDWASHMDKLDVGNSYVGRDRIVTVTAADSGVAMVLDQPAETDLLTRSPPAKTSPE